MDTKVDRYEGIDGLKAYAIIGIALMHILTNGEYRMGGFVFERMIPSFTNLVFLFMMVSGFGMCCGYYQKFKDQKIGVVDFYKKRYSKIWPYFALLCVLDFVMSPSISALYEVFANLTLCQGLLPNMNISSSAETDNVLAILTRTERLGTFVPFSIWTMYSRLQLTFAARTSCVRFDFER